MTKRIINSNNSIGWVGVLSLIYTFLGVNNNILGV